MNPREAVRVLREDALDHDDCIDHFVIGLAGRHNGAIDTLAALVPKRYIVEDKASVGLGACVLDTDAPGCDFPLVVASYIPTREQAEAHARLYNEGVESDD